VFAASSGIPREDTWITNGAVRAIATTATTTYIGGDFTYVGPNTGSGVPIDMATEMPAGAFPEGPRRYPRLRSGRLGRLVHRRQFHPVGPLARNRIAHILADGSVDSSLGS